MQAGTPCASCAHYATFCGVDVGLDHGTLSDESVDAPPEVQLALHVTCSSMPTLNGAAPLRAMCMLHLLS
jgi:hypothetical protein